MAAPATAIGSGLRITIRAHRPQKPLSGSVTATNRRGMTRRLLTRWPSDASSAGRSVSAAITDTAGISIPPIPIDRMTGMGMMTIDRSPIATVEPETTTDRPACRMVSTTAVSTSSPWASSSRKRKIISSE
jgi:hypothetical protein